MALFSQYVSNIKASPKNYPPANFLPRLMYIAVYTSRKRGKPLRKTGSGQRGIRDTCQNCQKGRSSRPETLGWSASRPSGRQSWRLAQRWAQNWPLWQPVLRIPTWAMRGWFLAGALSRTSPHRLCGDRVGSAGRDIRRSIGAGRLIAAEKLSRDSAMGRNHPGSNAAVLGLGANPRHRSPT